MSRPTREQIVAAIPNSTLIRSATVVRKNASKLKQVQAELMLLKGVLKGIGLDVSVKDAMVYFDTRRTIEVRIEKNG
jgi:hypothetical protein